MSLIHHATYFGLYSEVITIIAESQKKVQIEAQDDSLQRDNPSQISLKNPILDEGNPFGDAPLHIAACQGHLLIVRYLLAQGANVNLQNKAGSTPLHKAVVGGSDAIIKCLLANGANRDIKNNYGFYPEDYARNNIFLFKQLLGKKASTEEIVVPKIQHGILIGKQGKMRSEIRTETGVDVIIPKRDESTEVIKLFGRPEAIVKAKKKIEGLLREREKPPESDNVAQETKKTSTTSVSFPKDKHRIVIGKNGTMLKKITSQTGVEVWVPKMEDPSNVITLKGTMEGITEAIKVINGLMLNTLPESKPKGRDKGSGATATKSVGYAKGNDNRKNLGGSGATKKSVEGFAKGNDNRKNSKGGIAKVEESRQNSGARNNENKRNVKSESKKNRLRDGQNLLNFNIKKNEQDEEIEQKEVTKANNTEVKEFHLETEVFPELSKSQGSKKAAQQIDSNSSKENTSEKEESKENG